ncbi:MAG: peptidoglycan-binding protein, partial [Desulfobacterales bacterium]|nr:peptidoglycan-binding protein [Desulfobacterales bacterium]
VKFFFFFFKGHDLSDEVEWIKNPSKNGPCPKWSKTVNDTIEKVTNLLPGASNFGDSGNQDAQRSQIQSAEAYYDIYLPLRVARIQANLLNLLDFLKALETMLSEDLELIKKIDEKANLLINPDIAARIENATETAPPIPVRPAAVKVDLVREIQQTLTTLGYESGPIDGQFGPRTAQAIIQFQNDFGYPENRRATIEFLRIATYAHDLQSKGIDIKNNPQRIRQFFESIQETLRRLGFYSGAIDGRPGQGTCAAVNSFLDQCSVSGTCHISIHELDQIRHMGDLCRFVE